MPSHPQWLELLEEHAYLIQMLAEAAHDLGALEQTCSLLEVLRVDLRACTMQVADTERENVASTIGSITEKYEFGGAEKQDRLLAIWTTKQTLSIEVKNLEIKAQILQRQKRHHEELEHRLVALYARIAKERKPPSREEVEAEEDARRAQHNLYEIQKTFEQNKTLEALLRHGDYSLINAGRHLTGGSGGSSGVDAAKRCAIQTSVVVNQARRLDPSFFEHVNPEVLKVGWLREVFQTTSTTSDDSHPHPLLQALKPHHTALLSLISQAHKRTRECDAAIRRAAHQSSTVRARKVAIMRHVLATWANAEAECDATSVNKGFEKDGLGMSDITAGLESIIPLAGALRSSTAVSTYSSEEQPRLGQDQPASRSSPVSIPQTRPLQPARRPPLLNLTPDPVPPPKSTPLPTRPSSSGPSTHAQRDTQLRQPYPTTPQLHSADPTRAVFSSAGVIRQPKPVHQHNRRHPVLDQQHDRQWQSDSGVPYELNPRSQGGFPSGTNEHDTLEPHPGQPDVQLPPPSSMPTLPPLSNPSTDRRPPSASTQYSRPATAELPMLPPIPQSQPMRLPQVNKTPLYQSDSRNPKSTRVSTSSDVRTPPPSTVTSVSPRPAVHGILKRAPVAVSPRPSIADDADPWGLGVKVAAAPSSRPQPKLKNVFSLWRGTESSNTSHPRVASQPELQPQSLLESKRPNPRAATQMLRFSEAVEIIPRPAVDSDPYDDEEDDKLPPSPTRGSVIWLENEEGMSEDSGDSSGNLQEMKWRHDVAGVPVNPNFSVDPSQSSISSASSSHLTEYTTYSTHSSFATPLSSDLYSSSRSFPQYLPSYSTSQDNGLPPLRDQPSSQKGERDDSKGMPTEARENTHKDPSASRWLDAAYTTSPQDSHNLPLAGGRIEREYDLSRADTRSRDADKARLMSSPRPNTALSQPASNNPSRQITQGNMKSNRELLQTIFPSPAQSSFSHHDFTFTS